MPKIRLGVIGLGSVSRRHINETLASPDAEVVALCDANRDTLMQKAAQYGIPDGRCFTDHADLLKCPDVDAVSICTPNRYHFGAAMDAVSAKKPFAIEKPVTMTHAEAVTLQRAAKDAGVLNMACFTYRFKSAARYARHLAETGHLGRIYHVYAQYLQSWGQNPDRPMVWRMNREIAGSGAHGDLGSHMYDLICFITGKNFTRVCAHAGTYLDTLRSAGGKVDVDDFCHVLFSLDGGASGTAVSTRYAFARGNWQRVEIYGDRGAVIYSLENYPAQADTLDICLGPAYAETRTFTRVLPPQQHESGQMQSFFDMLNGKGDGKAATMDDGERNQRVIDAVTESFEGEKWVEL